MILWGLSGTNGSGKDILAGFLVSKHNFLYVSSSDLLRDEARKRGMPVGRDVLRDISAEWRREGGLGILIDKAVALYTAQGGDANYAGLITGSIRNPGEADRIHELNGKMIWLDADPKIRYARVTGADRGRGDNEAAKTYEQFLSEQQAEMKHSGDAATLSIADVYDRCDIFIQNDSGTLEEFYDLAENALGLK